VTPADEARFIALWNAGTETAAIAQQLGIPVGTVSSRAHRLQQQDIGSGVTSDVTSNRRR
jgi:hypothetical protein